MHLAEVKEKNAFETIKKPSVLKYALDMYIQAGTERYSLKELSSLSCRFALILINHLGHDFGHFYIEINMCLKSHSIANVATLSAEIHFTVLNSHLNIHYLLFAVNHCTSKHRKLQLSQI
jgi:hypothetical protein